MKSHEVRGGGGIRLHVREWGQPHGIPLVFIHGWSQCHLSWIRQCDSALADSFRIIAFDLRGHGMSEAPLAEEHYTDGEKWADDVASILQQLSMVRPIVIAWSYGACVISDYIKKYGDQKLGGINFVAGTVVLGRSPFFGPTISEHGRGACADDLATNILAMRGFLRGCFGPSISADDFEEALAYNMVVPPKIRLNLLKREVDFAPVLETIRVPVLVTHGRGDTVILPSMSDYILDHCKTASVSWYEDAHHGPFLEEPARFNSELAAFARAASGRQVA